MDKDINLISLKELAIRLCTSTTNIGNWEDKSHDEFIGPFPKGKKDGREKLYNWKSCLQWYTRFVSFNQYKDLFATNATLDYDLNNTDWAKRKQRAAALREENELAKELKTLIDANKVVSQVSNLVVSLKSEILNLSPRLSGRLGLSLDKKKELENEVTKILNELSEFKFVIDDEEELEDE